MPVETPLETPLDNKRFRVLTYSLTSESGNLLREELGGHQFIRPDGSQYRYRETDVVVNWGLYGDRGYPVVNAFNAVRVCTSKRRTFQAFRMSGVKHPNFTKQRDTALGWIRDGHTVFARSCDNGMMGEGITVVHPGEEVPQTLFYTKRFPVDREFRVYVAFGLVIDVREKKRLEGDTDGTWQAAGDAITGAEIRAGDDWMYCKRGLANYPTMVWTQAGEAMEAVGLDFGGVDVAIDKEHNVCVFEVNSAPWLPPSTARKLAQAIKDKYE